MIELIPLIQTLLWMVFSIVLIFLMRKEIRTILKIVELRLHSGSGFKIGPVEIGELKSKIDTVEKKVIVLNENVSKLFLLTMAEPMYKNLKKLNSGKFGEYKVNKGLERELYHLRDIGYISIESIKSIPEEGNDLSAHVKITDAGKMFVLLRDEYL